MEIDFVNSGLDIIEGVVAGGILGMATYIIGDAVSLLPGAFISASAVGPLAIVVGALGFVGYSIKKIRGRISV